MNLTTKDLETILYSLEGYMQANDDTELVEELEDICYRIDKELEEKYKESEEINELKVALNEGRLEGESNNNSDKVYPQVDNVPEQVYQDWLYNKEEENDNEIDKITDEFDKLERENDSLKSLLKEVN